MIKISFFDAKPYDIESFSKYSGNEFELKFFETKLSTDTVELAKNSDVVCIFVNDNMLKFYLFA